MANVVPLRRASARAALKKNSASATKKTSKKTTKKVPTKKTPGKADNKKTPIKSRRSNPVVKKKKSAKKTIFRAPRQEEFDKISIGSNEDAEEEKKEIKSAKGKKRVIESRKKSKGKAKKSKATKKTSSDSDSTSTESISESSDPAPVVVKTRKAGRPARLVQPFLGGQKMASFAKKFFNSIEIPAKTSANGAVHHAIVVEKSKYDLTRMRRPRSPWSAKEIEHLKKGVVKHGEGSWAAILNDSALSFYGNRTQVDLKDKWRNMNSYVPYNNHPIRRFVLVNSKHEIVHSAAGNPHVFNNRWPRDAAMKVATRDEFYAPNENGEAPDAILIHLKEIVEDRIRSEKAPLVHVYRGTRVLERSKDIKKFAGYAAIWTSKVEKVAEEILIKSSDVFSVEEEASIMSKGSPKKSQ